MCWSSNPFWGVLQGCIPADAPNWAQLSSGAEQGSAMHSLLLWILHLVEASSTYPPHLARVYMRLLHPRRMLQTMSVLTCYVFSDECMQQGLQQGLYLDAGSQACAAAVSQALEQPGMLALLTLALQANVSAGFLQEEEQQAAARMRQLLWEALDSAYRTVRGQEMLFAARAAAPAVCPALLQASCRLRRLQVCLRRCFHRYALGAPQALLWCAFTCVHACQLGSIPMGPRGNFSGLKPLWCIFCPAVLFPVCRSSLRPARCLQTCRTWRLSWTRTFCSPCRLQHKRARRACAPCVSRYEPRRDAARGQKPK